MEIKSITWVLEEKRLGTPLPVEVAKCLIAIVLRLGPAERVPY